MRTRFFPSLALLAAFVLGACAHIPEGRYGVDKLEILGVDDLDRFALQACLATQERQWLSIDLSKEPAPTCGKPPFDARRLHLPLWRWAWTDWPLYEPSVFERDLARIERWYRARGYYGASVLKTTSEPEEALYGTRTDKNKIRLQVTVSEGEPVRVFSASLQGTNGLDESLSQELMAVANEIQVDDRFDEAIFDQTELKLERLLRDGGYASAEVEGRVDIDPKQRSAVIAFNVKPGPFSEFGEVCVEGFGKLPPRLILQASDLRPGRPFSETDLEDARTRIYQMRVFSEVELVVGRQDPRTGANQFPGENGKEGEWLAWQNNQATPVAGGEPEVTTDCVCRLPKKASKNARVPIEIRVKPAKLYRLGFGAGLQIGVEDGQRAINATQQWDVHLFTYAEVKNFLGGLRRLRIEERPRLVFLAPFPRLEDAQGQREPPRFGNTLSTILEWPAFLEARTMLRFNANWDRGPDPYGAKFIRDDIDIGLGPSRSFFKNRLNTSFAIHFNPYIPKDLFGDLTTIEAIAVTQLKRTEGYHLLFLQQVLEWDTRDDRASTHRGTLARFEIHETLPPSEWFYLRVTPELRQFFPLPYGLVLGARAGIGWIKVYTADTGLSDQLQHLGPRPYRLRGGGPYSVRGVQAGALGQTNLDTVLGFPGGTRSWIASVELRVPLGDSFGIASFVDVGDVDGGTASQPARFRFDRPNTTLGGGLRYKTIVGPIRLDVGWLVPGLQGDPKGRSKVNREDPLFRFNGAVHLTIGEAF
ncbi:MAG: BamA/TamA family outer membrane protein [Myxococcales bacterium]